MLALACFAASAQSVSTTYVPDVNGRVAPVESTVSTNHTQTLVVQNLNGRAVPLRQVDERILRESGGTKVTERIIRRYDANGQLASTERELAEEQTRSNGSTLHVTTYRSDVNGRLAEVERQTIETEKQGSVEKTQSTIERPTLNGSFQAVQKSSSVTQTTAAGSQTDETTYQASQNGGFVVTARQVKETTQSGNQTTEKTALYQPFSETTQQMRLTEQTVSTTTKRPDGSESIAKTYYGSSWSGRVRDSESGPQLRAEDLIERKPGPGGSVVETLTARRVNPNDPNKLGPPQKISETICTGKCGGN